MSVSGGGNLYPNWLGSASLTIPSNTAIVNGKVVNVVPIVDTTNRTTASVTANNKTLFYTLPGTYAAGVYSIQAEFQSQNTGGGQTAYLPGDSVEWTVQGIADANPDYADCVYRPYYACYNDGATTGTGASNTGIVKATPTGLTGITADNTQIGVYVKYNTSASGTITQTFTMTAISIQKIA